MATVVSERYALSLYEVAKAENLAADMCEALGEVSEIFSAYPDYLKVLTTPSISLEDKREKRFGRCLKIRYTPICSTFCCF